MNSGDGDILRFVARWRQDNTARFLNWGYSYLPDTRAAAYGWERPDALLVDAKVFRGAIRAAGMRPLYVLQLLRSVGDLHVEGKGLTCRVKPPPYTKSQQVVWLKKLRD